MNVHSERGPFNQNRSHRVWGRAETKGLSPVGLCTNRKRSTPRPTSLLETLTPSYVVEGEIEPKTLGHAAAGRIPTPVTDVRTPASFPNLIDPVTAGFVGVLVKGQLLRSGGPYVVGCEAAPPTWTNS
jgi:hypothetical protein